MHINRNSSSFKKLSQLCSALVVFSMIFGPVATMFADPIKFPESGVYEFDFSADPTENGWTLEIEVEDEFGEIQLLSFWDWQPVPESGANEIVQGDYGEGVVRASNNGFDDLEFGGADFPIDPIVEAKSYIEAGFTGDWLQNLAVGNSVENDDGIFVPAADGIASLGFTDLPPHEAIKLTLKLAVGGSVDTGDNGNKDFPFNINVDGDEIWGFMPNSNGTNLDGSQGITTLALRENLAGVHVERWQDVNGEGPVDEGDREEVGWTLDSGYDLASVPQLVSIPHSADTLTIDFIHRMSSAFTDEHIAIDDVKVELIGEGAGAPDKWPGGDTYAQDFDGDVGAEWNIGTQWTLANVHEGVDAMTGEGNGTGLIRFSAHPDGFGESAFLEEGDPSIYPTEPLVEVMPYKEVDPRFDGKWLSTNSNPNRDGTATLTFSDLPPHTGIDIDFVLAAFDSIDGDDVIPDAELGNSNFIMKLDGETIYEERFNSGGALANLEFYESIGELGNGLNSSINHREQWNGDIDVGPIDEDDRTAIGWTLDSAYDYSALFDEDGEVAIEHTADNLTLSFIHGLNSDANDEGLAIDSFVLKLIGATPGVEFEITDVTYSDDPRSVSITWPSVSGQTFGVDRSLDLQDWSELDDGVEADEGETTTFTDENIPPEADRAYYRVRQG